jgi:glucan phosphoethanolaminetransferase (alkaline phosphatase superfamily)
MDKPKHPGRAQWTMLILLNCYLVSPVALGALSKYLAFEQPDKLLLLAVPASVLTLTTLHAWIVRPMHLHLALMPLYLAVAVDLYLIAHYGVRLSSSSISVILGNEEHVSAFVDAQARSIFVPLCLGLALYVLALVQLRGLSLVVPRWRRWASTLALASIYLLLSVKQIRVHGTLKKGLLDAASHDFSSPLGALSQGVVALVVHSDASQHEQRVRGFRFNARRDGPADARLIVLVLGESSRPDHWSLYGYGRDTTPGLRTRENVLAFRDVTAQASLTNVSVPLIITRAHPYDLGALDRERSVITAYREAGYRTAWLSTQQRDHWTGAINRYTTEADVGQFFERRHDIVLVQALEEWLAAPEQRGQPVLAVLHTQGSHYGFRDRYPKAFQRYSGARDDHQTLIDSYDNTILYTDYVLGSLIDVLLADPRPSALFYIADHGENLRDDSRQLFGHFICNDKDIPVPMLLWFSPAFASAEPERVGVARSHLSRRLSTAVAFDTLLDLGRVEIERATPSTKSLLRPTFRERRRLMVTNDGRVVDFDANYPLRRRLPVPLSVAVGRTAPSSAP